MLGAIARTAARLCDAADALIYLVDGDHLRFVAQYGRIPLPRRLGDRRPISRTTPLGRALIDRRAVHVRDMKAAALKDFPGIADLARTLPVRTVLAMPLLRQGGALGGFVIRRTRVQPFTPKQIALLKTFADQAAIAIENARLSEQLAARNRELTEALEQQTATAEILRVISSSPTDLRPVLETIAENAARVCGANDANIFLVDGETVRRAAKFGTLPTASGADAFPLRRESPTGRAILDRQTLHIHDVVPLLDTEFPQARANFTFSGARTLVATPLLREGAAIGSILIRRMVVRPFSDRQVELLKTFADQAVIAIENVRLFTELHARNRDLTEALEQRTATAEILRVIAASPTELGPVFDTIVESARRLCDAFIAALFRVEEGALHLVSHHGWPPAALDRARRTFPLPVTDTGLLARAAAEGRMFHVPDALEVSGLLFQETVGYRSLLLVPLLRDGRVVGVISVAREQARPFSETQVALLETFADQAVIAIENARLFNELRTRNSELTEALNQQTATSDILRVISSSPTDLQPVLDAVATNAARVCGAYDATVMLREGDLLRRRAHHGPIVSAVREVRPVDRDSVSGRAVLDRAPVHVHDILATDAGDLPVASESAHRAGFRTLLAVPLLRGTDAIGSLTIRQREVQPFSDKAIALLQTFADQAVIAIENVRLFTELEARNRDLTESLERQTATAEILRVISGAHRDVRPVFDAIVQSAVRLCGALTGGIFRLEGGLLRRVSHAGATTPEWDAIFRTLVARPPSRDRTGGWAVLERRMLYVPDIEADDRFPTARQLARTIGSRSILAVPLLQEGVALGAIVLTKPAPFPESEMGLIRTFADQAVIAIENARLFTELEARNADLTEALEQQTATSDILRVISSSQTDAQPVFDAIASRVVRLCDAFFSTVWRYDGTLVHHAADNYPTGEMRAILTKGYPAPAEQASAVGKAISERRIIHVEDLLDDTAPAASRDVAIALGYRTLLCVPMLRDGVAIGAIAIARREQRPFSDKQISLVRTFADQAVIAVENVRLFTELQARNRELTEALEQQTATGEILRAISSSPTDVQPVFDTIVRNAARLCEAASAWIFLLDGDWLVVTAPHNIPPGLPARIHVTDAPNATRVIREGTTFHVSDAAADPRVTPFALSWTQAAGMRAFLHVPMRRDEMPVGSIVVLRQEAGSFSDTQIELLKTFADQAVIAIENVRLFTELEARTQELTRSVAQLTALGEVGQAVSSTLDLETVLTTIVSRAVQLTTSDGGTIFEYDEATEQFRQRATERLSAVLETDAQRQDIGRFLRPWADAPQSPLTIKKGEGVVGQLPDARTPIQIADIAAPGAYHGPLREMLLASGIRAVLTVPLLREDRLVGALTVNRRTPGAFSPEVIELLTTFATQSAIAIQNARLFRELEAKGRELEAASRHKSEFLANMSHELRTPMNAILGYTELIADGIYGGVPERMREVLGRVEGSGRHLLGLINDVLDLSKIEAGQLTLTLADYAMKEVVDAVVASVESLAAEKGLRLVVETAPELPTGRGDQRRLAQVLLNLVGNAIKFTEQGQVAIRVGAAGGLFTVAVSDTGPGIAPADQERIFEEFQQADTSTTRPKGGTGLGLAIARRIVAMHGGRIWVESAPGEGATFRFTLPVRVDAQVR